jgi:hypothetical protein
MAANSTFLSQVGIHSLLHIFLLSMTALSHSKPVSTGAFCDRIKKTVHFSTNVIFGRIHPQQINVRIFKMFVRCLGLYCSVFGNTFLQRQVQIGSLGTRKLTYCASPWREMVIEQQWINNCQGRIYLSEVNPSGVTVSTVNPTLNKLAMNPELHGEIAVTNYVHYENCALLGYYAASSGNFSPTFRDNLSSWNSLLFKMRPTGCPETSVYTA